MSIYIRPLEEKDAGISYQWRNDPEVWKLTGSKPDRTITHDIELDWIRKVLARDNEKRFAICIENTHTYIGNVQLTGINSYEAEFHIFIGAKEYWGKGFATEATRQMVDYAFDTLKLQSVYLYVKKGNIAAIKAYQKAGFDMIVSSEENVRMAIYVADKVPKMVSVLMLAYNHGPFIQQALEGILQQQCSFAYEIVAGDDCSTDDTRKTLLAYADKYPGKIKLLLHNPNIGAMNNQLAVMKACKGKYMAICEGDDYWTDTHKLQKQVDFLEQHPDFAITFHRVSIKHESTPNSFTVTKAPDVEEEYTINDLASRNFIHTVSVLFRNNLFAELPVWYKESPVGDYPLHMLNAQYGKIKYFPEVMAIYREHSGGSWSPLTIEKVRSKWMKVLDLLINAGFEASVVANLKRQKTQAADSYLRALMRTNAPSFLEELKRLSAEDETLKDKFLFEHYPQKIDKLNKELDKFRKHWGYRIIKKLRG